MILLDTHVLLWALTGSDELGRRSRRLLDSALAHEKLAVSAISFWELSMLAERGRIRLSVELTAWRTDALRLGIVELGITGQIAIAAGELTGIHGDPADRLIIASASLAQASLMTADTRILLWKNRLRRHDARR